MREPLFIKKNKDKWEHYDNEPSTDPDVLSERFVHILDDLAYAQTFYPRGKTVKYLNERAVQFYNEIYKKKRERFSRLFDFWRYDLPLVIRKNQKLLLWSLLIFLGFYFLGYLSALYENDFLGTILGQGYTDYTKENIAKGDPFGIYARDGEFVSFITIGFNNIMLAFTREFMSGIFFGLSSLYGLMQTGMLVGSAHQFWNSFGYGWEVLMVVYIHGIFELFALVVAAACGFRLFNSFLFPGTYTRLQSLKKGAMEGMKMMVTVFIMLVIAAFLEGYITRLAATTVAGEDINRTALKSWGIFLILFACAAVIIWYFGIYPAIAQRKMRRLATASKPEQRLGEVKMNMEAGYA